MKPRYDSKRLLLSSADEMRHWRSDASRVSSVRSSSSSVDIGSSRDRAVHSYDDRFEASYDRLGHHGTGVATDVLSLPLLRDVRDAREATELSGESRCGITWVVFRFDDDDEVGIGFLTGEHTRWLAELLARIGRPAPVP